MRKLLILNILCLIAFTSLAQTKDELLKKAEAGNVAAQLQLAKYYYDTENSDYSYTESLKWYQKAAENGNVEAMIACGDILCDLGMPGGVEPDFVKGIGWYRKAAAKGSKDAKTKLADFNFGQVPISHECVYDWFAFDEDLDNYQTLKAHESQIKQQYAAKNPMAAYYLAIISFVEKDFKKCVDYLTEIYPLTLDENNEFDDFLDDGEYGFKSSTIGVRVLGLLGWVYEHGLGVNQDKKKAAEYYLTDFDYSAFWMPQIPKIRAAYCYKQIGEYDKFKELADTIGVGVIGIKEEFYPVPWLQMELAEMYRTGEGVKQDKKKAVEIYEAVVDKRKGIIDQELNAVDSTSGSLYDIGEAAYRVSKMYGAGEGVKADSEMAQLYFDIALKYGNSNAWYENENKNKK